MKVQDNPLKQLPKVAFGYSLYAATFLNLFPLGMGGFNAKIDSAHVLDHFLIHDGRWNSTLMIEVGTHTFDDFTILRCLSTGEI